MNSPMWRRINSAPGTAGVPPQPPPYPPPQAGEGRVGAAGRPRSQVTAGAPVQSVDLIIADIAWLITMDPGRRVIRDAAVAVDGGRVVAVGKSADVTARYTGKSGVDGRNAV